MSFGDNKSFKFPKNKQDNLSSIDGLDAFEVFSFLRWANLYKVGASAQSSI